MTEMTKADEQNIISEWNDISSGRTAKISYPLLNPFEIDNDPNVRIHDIYWFKSKPHAVVGRKDGKMSIARFADKAPIKSEQDGWDRSPGYGDGW
jgi:hypothetical protein